MFRSKRFPKAPQAKAATLAEETRLRLLGRIGPAAPAGKTFADDVRAYLRAVADMPTIRHRTDDMALWVDVFGLRSRHDISALEIRTQLAALGAHLCGIETVNHRRTALMHFFTTMNGKSGANPVRDVPRYRDESLDAPPRDLSAAACDRRRDAHESDEGAPDAVSVERDSAPATMARIRLKEDVRWNVALYLRPRRKGKGAKGTWVPLLPEAWTALEDFRRLGCEGP